MEKKLQIKEKFMKTHINSELLVADHLLYNPTF